MKNYKGIKTEIVIEDLGESVSVEVICTLQGHKFIGRKILSKEQAIEESEESVMEEIGNHIERMINEVVKKP